MSRYDCGILARRDGTTAIEYSLIAGLVSIIIVGLLTVIGSTISNNFFGPIVGAL